MVLVSGLATLLLALVVQVIWVRCLRPADHARVILSVFGVVIAAAAAALFAGGHLDVCGVARFSLLTLSLAGMYLIVYAAVEDDSPSMAMVRFAAQGGAAGRTRDDFRVVLRDDLLFGERVAAMKREGWVEEREGGVLHLTRRGTLIGRFYLRLQHWLRMDEGG